MNNKRDLRKQAEVLFDDIYGKGHGKEMTVTRYVLVLGLTESEAYEMFDTIYNEVESTV